MNTEQELKSIKIHLDRLYLEMNAVKAMVQHLSEQPDSNSSELPNSSGPNHYIPKVGEVVEVSDGIGWGRRVFIEYKKDAKTHHFKCLSAGAGDEDELKYRNGDTTYDASGWRYCRRLNGEIIEFGCDAKQEVPPTPNADNFEYIDLLPQGYEFCAEEMVEKWIKVKNPTEANPLGHIWQLDKRPHLAIIGEYRPIRKIQTASYQVDWSDAPEWAYVHCWDKDGKSYWYGVTRINNAWDSTCRESSFTLPAGLDWKLSKTYRPQ